MFGGASSPSFSSYALNRTAIDNNEKFDNANILINNFCIVNLLKSLASIEEAIKMLSRCVQLENSSPPNL